MAQRGSVCHELRVSRREQNTKTGELPWTAPKLGRRDTGVRGPEGSQLVSQHFEISLVCLAAFGNEEIISIRGEIPGLLVEAKLAVQDEMVPEGRMEMEKLRHGAARVHAEAAGEPFEIDRWKVRSRGRICRFITNRRRRILL